MVDKIVEGSTETTTEMTVKVEVGTGLEKGGFPEIMAIIELEAQAVVDPGQDPELVQIGIEYIVISVVIVNIQVHLWLYASYMKIFKNGPNT